ncbi:MAG: aldo/keto reductase [Phycisphaeraceae bacterium]
MAAACWQNPFAPRRALGRTGFIASQLGIGDLADRAVPIEQCVATARRAIDAGLNVIDTAPGYENGYSEEIVGRAVKGRRDELFVIDKIDHYDQPVADQVHGSLRRLRLDHTDLFVFHHVASMNDWRMLTAPGGPMDELGRCVREGKTRFRGVSCHHPDVVEAAIDSGLCEVVMFPVGPFVDHRYPPLVKRASEKNVGTVCFKTFGAGKLLSDTTGYNQPLTQRPRGKLSSGGGETVTACDQPMLPRLTVEQCVHFTLTVDPDVALLGMSFANEQDAAFEAAKRFEPMNQTRMRAVQAEAAVAIQDKGRIWWNPQ